MGCVNCGPTSLQLQPGFESKLITRKINSATQLSWTPPLLSNQRRPLSIKGFHSHSPTKGISNKEKGENKQNQEPSKGKQSKQRQRHSSINLVRQTDIKISQRDSDIYGFKIRTTTTIYNEQVLQLTMILVYNVLSL